jgi:hypothetical protein
MARKKLELLGQRFGKLTVMEESSSRRGKSMWKCSCTCGNEKMIRGFDLTRGKSTSCGSCGSFATNMEPRRHAIYITYKRCAKERGYEFNITSEQFKALTKQPCIYCGAQPVENHKGGYKDPIKFNGIDRKDNTKGYEEDNCFPCCKTCNLGKNNMTYEEHQAYIEQLVLHTLKQKPHLIVSIERFNYCNREL